MSSVYPISPTLHLPKTYFIIDSSGDTTIELFWECFRSTAHAVGKNKKWFSAETRKDSGTLY